jgi:hypothetical protein
LLLIAQLQAEWPFFSFYFFSALRSCLRMLLVSRSMVAAGQHGPFQTNLLWSNGGWRQRKFVLGSRDALPFQSYCLRQTGGKSLESLENGQHTTVTAACTIFDDWGEWRAPTIDIAVSKDMDGIVQYNNNNKLPAELACGDARRDVVVSGVIVDSGALPAEVASRYSTFSVSLEQAKITQAAPASHKSAALDHSGMRSGSSSSNSSSSSGEPLPAAAATATIEQLEEQVEGRVLRKRQRKSASGPSPLETPPLPTAAAAAAAPAATEDVEKQLESRGLRKRQIIPRISSARPSQPPTAVAAAAAATAAAISPSLAATSTAEKSCVVNASSGSDCTEQQLQQAQQYYYYWQQQQQQQQYYYQVLQQHQLHQKQQLQQCAVAPSTQHCLPLNADGNFTFDIEPPLPIDVHLHNQMYGVLMRAHLCNKRAALVQSFRQKLAEFDAMEHAVMTTLPAQSAQQQQQQSAEQQSAEQQQQPPPQKLSAAAKRIVQPAKRSASVLQVCVQTLSYYHCSTLMTPCQSVSVC